MKRLRELTGALLQMPHYLVPIHGCKMFGFPTKQVRVVHRDSIPLARSIIHILELLSLHTTYSNLINII